MAQSFEHGEDGAGVFIGEAISVNGRVDLLNNCAFELIACVEHCHFSKWRR